MFLVQYAKTDLYCRCPCQTGLRRDHRFVVVLFFLAGREEGISQLFHDQIRNEIDTRLQNALLLWIHVFRGVTAKDRDASALWR